jgi:beta-aspartyl-peptidase (threonine type)
MNPDFSLVRLALHGGAGDPPPNAPSQQPHEAALQRIAARARAALLDGASALDAVTAMIEDLEQCPLFNAGIGAVLNSEGQPELDAAIMNGSDLAAGAVTGVMHLKSPIRAARLVMEQSPHVMMMGAGAETLCLDLGAERVEPSYFIIEERVAQLEAARKAGKIVLDHDAAFGTVGAVARDAWGNLAAGTSTGGLTNKRVGRIGDTPVIGSGTFANDRVAVSCTGTGECFIKGVVGHDIAARVRYGQQGLLAASEAALSAVKALGGRGGLIALDTQGNVVLPFNAYTMYRAWVDESGTVQVGIGR